MAKAPRKWTQEEISYLGMTPDSRLSAYLGVSISQICRKRKELGIPHYKPVRLKKTVKQQRAEKPARSELSKLRGGLMIKVGKILVKRCPSCLVAWPLAEFVSSNRTTTGCKGPCATCRGVKKFEE